MIPAPRSSNSGAENKDIHQPQRKAAYAVPSILQSRLSIWLPLPLAQKAGKASAGTVKHSLHSPVCLVSGEAAWFTRPHEACQSSKVSAEP